MNTSTVSTTTAVQVTAQYNGTAYTRTITVNP